MPWTSALVGFELERQAAGLTAESIRVELGHLSRLARTLPDPWAVQTDDLRKYAAAASWTPNTAHRFRTAVRNFYAWAELAGHLDHNPAPAAAIPPPGGGRPWRPDDFQALTDLPEAWSTALTAWITYSRAAGRSSGTIDLYFKWLLRVAHQHPDPWSITTNQLLSFQSTPGWAPETRRSVRVALRSFFGWALAAGKISIDPAMKLPAVRVPAGLPRPASSAHVSRALSAADHRSRLMILLGRLAGLRRMEIAKLHARDVLDCQHGQPDGHDLHVTGKGGRQRVIHLHPDIVEHLQVLLPGNGYIFPGQIEGHLSPAHVGKLISSALPAGTTPHQLRHAAATAWYAVDRDLLAVQQLLGHSNPATTQRYTAIPSDAHLRAVTEARL